MSAVLGAPVVGVAAAGPLEVSATAVEHVVRPGTCSNGGDAATTAAAIREQFRASFTAGAVSLPTTDLVPVICETS